MTDDNGRRVVIKLNQEQFDMLNRRVRYGLRSHLVAAILRLVLDAIEREGEVVVGVILEGKLKLVRNDDQ